MFVETKSRLEFAGQHGVCDFLDKALGLRRRSRFCLPQRPAPICAGALSLGSLANNIGMQNYIMGMQSANIACTILPVHADVARLRSASVCSSSRPGVAGARADCSRASTARARNRPDSILAAQAVQRIRRSGGASKQQICGELMRNVEAVDSR